MCIHVTTVKRIRYTSNIYGGPKNRLRLLIDGGADGQFLDWLGLLTHMCVSCGGENERQINIVIYTDIKNWCNDIYVALF